MKRVCVLGAGLVGGPMALDLASAGQFEVTVADRDKSSLAGLSAAADLKTRVCDLSDSGVVSDLCSGSDLILEAMPGWLGFRTLRTIIESGTDVVSISFFPEDPFDLDTLARDRGVTAVMDCGVFPGMGSALIMDAVTHRLDHTERITILVGGLPEHPDPPLHYRAVFSPADVIEEYVRPARHLEGGEIVVRPALSDVEPVQFEGIGDLECFSTDGLRTLIRTIPCPNIREKTLRVAGTAAQMSLFRDVGLFDEQPIEIGGQRMRPRDLTMKLLSPLWRMPKGEGDVTAMRIEILGEKDGMTKKICWELLDRWDRDAGILSMARTTGYTATAALRMIADGTYTHPGISPPEYLGRNSDRVRRMLSELAERNVQYREVAQE